MSLAALGNPKSCDFLFERRLDGSDETLNRSNILENLSIPILEENILSRIVRLSNHPEILEYERNAASIKFLVKKKQFLFSREDIAAGLQSTVEKWVVNSCKYSVKKFVSGNSLNISLAGGLFANVKITLG